MTDRMIVTILRDICQKQGIALASYSDNWVLLLTKQGKSGGFIGYKTSLNDSFSAGVACDKVAAYQLLAAAGVPAAAHYLVRADVLDEAIALLPNMQQIVIKPLQGTGGRLVNLVSSLAEVKNSIEHSPIEAWAASPWLPIVSEQRVIILDDKVLLSYGKRPIETSGLVRFNLGLGALPEGEADAEARELAHRAMNALRLKLAAVDIVTLETGERLVLEVNDGIMMENYARISPLHQKNAYGVYEKIVRAMVG